VILAEDEAIIYLQATTTYVWAPQGQTPVVRVHPGRDKVCFYGTLNLDTGEDIITREPGMNSEATTRHLQEVLDTVPDKPILLLWDRAKWHGGQAVRNLLAANPRLEVMPLPTAAPDLNPQEQVWKATRGAVGHNHDVRQLRHLAERFEQHLTSTSFHITYSTFALT
jgi:transposase